MTEPGQACPVCGVPDPGHDWDEHERQAAGVEFDRRDVMPPGARGATSMLARSSSRGGAAVRWLAVHSTEGIMRATDLRDWQSWPGSSHASADADGRLLEPADGFVPYERAAWTLRNGNPVSENIELCAWARWTRAEWLARPALLERCAEWLAKRSRATGIPLRKLTVAQVAARLPGVIDHDDYTDATGDGTHWDVGESFPWDLVIPRARELAGAGTIDPTTPEGFLMALDDAEQTEALGILRDLRWLTEAKIDKRTPAQALRDLLAIGTDVRTRLSGIATTLTGLKTPPSAGFTAEQIEALADEVAERLSAEQARTFLDALSGRLES